MRFSCVAMGLLFSAAMAPAAVLVSYDFGTAPSSSYSPYSPDTVAPHVSATQLSVGGGTVGAYSNDNAGYYIVQSWSPTFSADSHYLSFSITPGEGYALEMTGISFTWDLSSVIAPLKNVAVRSSLDGFSTDLLSDHDFDQFNLRQFQDAELSGLPLVTGEVTFRFYAWGDSEETSFASWHAAGFLGAAQGGSPLMIEGNVIAVPEPSVVALMTGATALMWVSVRRRRG